MYKTSIYVFGGWNGHDTLDDLNEFSVTTKQFYSVPGRGDVPSSRYRHSAVRSRRAAGGRPSGAACAKRRSIGQMRTPAELVPIPTDP